MNSYSINYSRSLAFQKNKQRYTGPSPEQVAARRGFSEAIAADPLNSTHHWAYSDWLRENRHEISADFHKAFGDWLQDGYSESRGSTPYSIKLGASLPGGMIPDQVKAHFKSLRARAPAASTIPYIADGEMSWPRSKDMIEAMHNAFWVGNGRPNG